MINTELLVHKNFKKNISQVADFLIESNLIIACGATLLALESLLLVNSISISALHLLVVFFSAMVVYHLAEMNVHIEIYNELKINYKNTEDNAFHGKMFVASAVVLCGFIPFLSLSQLLLLTILAVVSLTYGLISLPGSRLYFRSYPLLKNIMLAFMWAMVTVVYPLFAEGILLFSIESVLIFIERFFFILVLSFMFDLRDYFTDPKQGLKTSATIMGFDRLKTIAQILLMVFGLIVTCHLVILNFSPKSILSFIALYLSIVITSFFVFLTSKQKPKRFYSLLFDGATVIQAVLVLMLSLPIN